MSNQSQANSSESAAAIPTRVLVVYREDFPLPLLPGTPANPTPRPPPPRRPERVKFYQESKQSALNGLVQEIKYSLQPHPLRDLSQFLISMREVVKEHLLSILHAGKGVGFWVTIQVIYNHPTKEMTEMTPPTLHRQNYPSQRVECDRSIGHSLRPHAPTQCWFCAPHLRVGTRGHP